MNEQLPEIKLSELEEHIRRLKEEIGELIAEELKIVEELDKVNSRMANLSDDFEHISMLDKSRSITFLKLLHKLAKITGTSRKDVGEKIEELKVGQQLFESHMNDLRDAANQKSALENRRKIIHSLIDNRRKAIGSLQEIMVHLAGK